MKIVFKEVKLRGTKNCKCTGCGKTLRRQKTFSQTLNPFNKKKNGTLKTEGDIYEELKEEITKWKTKDDICSEC